MEQSIATGASAALMLFTTASFYLLGLPLDELKKRIQAYRSPIPYQAGSLVWELVEETFVQEYMRFTKEEVDVILPILKLHEIKYRNRYEASPHLAMTLLCLRLSYPSRLKDLIHVVGYSRAWCSIVFNDTVMFLARRYRKLLEWDHSRLSYTQISRYCRALKRVGGGHCIWGFIDGTSFQICRPSEQQEQYYSGHKHYHCFMYQAIVTPDGLVSSWMGPFPGKRNDWGMVRDTKLTSYLRELNDNRESSQRRYLYGDPAYSTTYGIMGTFKRSPNKELTLVQKRFNQRMSKLRIEVEHAFGIVTNIWQLMTKTSAMRLNSSPVAAYTTVAILLANILTCFRGNQTSQRFNCSPPDVIDYLHGWDESIESGDDED